MPDTQPQQVNILECTLRDGSYAFDFQFTTADTALLVKHLAQAGFRWIEIGHGLGIGAADAGKGKMPASDTALIRAAKDAAEGALIGAFFIPSFASDDLLASGRDAGLDFVRIGANANEAPPAFPALEKARSVGLIPAMNFMKTYAISPKKFGLIAADAAKAGAEIIYVVDSTGSMLPETVKAYISEAREHTDAKLGFHSHDNLKLAVSNSLTAIQYGASFVDGTLYGVGRGAGNAATEVLVALMTKLGIETGVELFNLLDIAEKYMSPLMDNVQLHNMLAVATGYGQFHSSFLPQVVEAAKKQSVDIKRLTAEMGLHDPVTLDLKFLEETAEKLARTTPDAASEELISYSTPSFTFGKINTTISAVDELVNGLVTTSSKRHGSLPALELVPSPTKEEHLILPEFVYADASMALGRLTVGSPETLQEILDRTRNHISYYFLDASLPEWAKGFPDIITETVGGQRLNTIDRIALKSTFIADVIERAARQYKARTLLIHGQDETLTTAITGKRLFERVIQLDASQPRGNANPEIIRLDSNEDWLSIDLAVDMILPLTLPSGSGVEKLSRALSPEGRIFCIDPMWQDALGKHFGDRLISINTNAAYAGLLPRLMAASVCALKK